MIFFSSSGMLFNVFGRVNITDSLKVSFPHRILSTTTHKADGTREQTPLLPRWRACLSGNFLAR